MDHHNDYYYNTSGSISLSGVEYTTIQSNNNLIFPERSEWYCELFGCGEGFMYNPAKGKEPNFFWRWMQYLCFGNKWKKK